MTPVLWNAMTSDWSDPSAQRIAAEAEVKSERFGGMELPSTWCCTTADIWSRRRSAGPSVTAVRLLAERFSGARSFVTLDTWLDACEAQQAGAPA